MRQLTAVRADLEISYYVMNSQIPRPFLTEKTRAAVNSGSRFRFRNFSLTCALGLPSPPCCWLDRTLPEGESSSRMPRTLEMNRFARSRSGALARARIAA